MNYEKLYYAIINKALRKQIIGQRFKGDGTYYESHHIKPHSLGGSDEDKNLVLLTAKEHYLCHWLLVKRYDVDSVERKKMIKAWYIMAAVGKTKRPKLNMNVYAKYRNEISETMSEAQSGKRNSQYGKHWYTSIDTGESYSFFEKPNDRWIEGRNLLNGRSSKIKYVIIKEKHVGNIRKKSNVIRVKISLEKQLEKTKLETQKMWNEYHSGNYKKLEDYAAEIKISKVALYARFKKYIPIFSVHTQIKRKNFFPNKALINVFE